MAAAEMSSRERMLRALDHREVDHVPCCFMSFTALRRRCAENLYELARAERQMGLDAMLFIPTAARQQRPEHPDLRGLPVRFDPQVQVREWRDGGPDGLDILHREYSTPGGKLSTSVRLTDDWPHGDQVPFVDDYQVPRALKPLIGEPQDLDALQYLLTCPSAGDVSAFAAEARQSRAFADEHGILLAGGWGVGVDMANWLCGMQTLTIWMLDQPGLVRDLLEMVHRWNMRRMEVVLSAPVDLYIRRAWYEGCDFVPARFHQAEVLPRLRAEVDLAHEHGVRFGYICSSGIGPMLDSYLSAGIDALIGIDPVQGTHTDMAHIKSRIGGRICLWGGVSGAATVEQGTEQEVRDAVRMAICALGPTGFILSPVDNITIDADRTWRNIRALIDEWRNYPTANTRRVQCQRNAKK